VSQSKHTDKPSQPTGQDATTEDIKNPARRTFLTAGAVGIAAASALPRLGFSAEERIEMEDEDGRTLKSRPNPNAPYDSLRDYMKATEDQGLVFHVKRLDQDNYEMTALMYRLIDQYGWYNAPAIMADEVKIDGKWVKGPVITNHQGHLETEAIVFGLDNTPGDSEGTYRRTISYLEGKIKDGSYPTIDPVEISAEDSPCKEVILRGDECDLTKFAFIKSNPGDSRRYINTGSIYTTDPVLGKNFGTYRCELRGPRLLGINPEPNQTGWKMLMAAKERGEKTAKISIAVGQDPITWITSGSRVVNRITDRGPIDEHAAVGGLRGKPLEVVKSETNDITVPAYSEMIIEGEVPLNETLPEGPFGEMYGYLGLKKEENFFMNVTCITHRKNPWIVNQFTGATRGYCTSPTAALYNTTLKGLVPGLIELHSPVESTGLTFVRIKKTQPGEGKKAGERLAKIIPIFKVVVVVDEDVDVMDTAAVGLAMGSRLQAETAVSIFSGRGMPLDPSAIERGKSGKLVIDATRQWPEEGGPESYPPFNRQLLEDLAPQSFVLVNDKYAKYIEPGRSWKGPKRRV